MSSLPCWLVEPEHSEFCKVLNVPQVFVTYQGALDYARWCIDELHQKVGTDWADDVESAVLRLISRGSTTFPTFSGGHSEATVRMTETRIHS